MHNDIYNISHFTTCSFCLPLVGGSVRIWSFLWEHKGPEVLRFRVQGAAFPTKEGKVFHAFHRPSCLLRSIFFRPDNDELDMACFEALRTRTAACCLLVETEAGRTRGCLLRESPRTETRNERTLTYYPWPRSIPRPHFMLWITRTSNGSMAIITYNAPVLISWLCTVIKWHI